jgi:hypothetical protein
MKMNYPVINYKFVTEKENLGDVVAELRDRPFTTYILQKGHYYSLPAVSFPETWIYFNTFVCIN